MQKVSLGLTFLTRNLSEAYFYILDFQTVREVSIKGILRYAKFMNLSSLIKIEKILNRPITKFYNSDDVNVIAAKLRLTKTRSTSFHKIHNLL